MHDEADQKLAEHLVNQPGAILAGIDQAAREFKDAESIDEKA